VIGRHKIYRNTIYSYHYIVAESPAHVKQPEGLFPPFPKGDRGGILLSPSIGESAGRSDRGQGVRASSPFQGGTEGDSGCLHFLPSPVTMDRMNSKERVQRTLARQRGGPASPIGFFFHRFRHRGKAARAPKPTCAPRPNPKSPSGKAGGMKWPRAGKKTPLALYRKLRFPSTGDQHLRHGPPACCRPRITRARAASAGWTTARLGWPPDRQGLEISPLTADLTLGARPDRSHFFAGSSSTWRSSQPSPDPSVFEVVDAGPGGLPGPLPAGPSGGEAGLVLLGGYGAGLRLYAEQPTLVPARHQLRNPPRHTLKRPLVPAPRFRRVLWGTDFAATAGPFILAAHDSASSAWPPSRRACGQIKSRGLAVWKHALRQQLEAAGYVRRSRLPMSTNPSSTPLDGYRPCQSPIRRPAGVVGRRDGRAPGLWHRPADVRRDAEYAVRSAAPWRRFTSSAIPIPLRWEPNTRTS